MKNTTEDGAGLAPTAFESAWREMEAANPLPPNMQIVEGGMSDEVMDFLDDIGRADTPEKMAELISLPNDQGEAQPPAK